MTTRCEYCDHEFTNVLMRRTCPRCGQSLKRPAATVSSSSSGPSTQVDDGFDGAGFVFGLTTGLPISPTRGVSVGSMLGASMHSDPAKSHSAPDPTPAPTPSYDPPSPSSSSSSYDSGSSSSSSYDSGSSSSGGSFDSGGGSF